LIIFLFLASLGFLFGEEGAAPFFPLLPLLETAVSGELRWRPDWPPEIPPDAFSPAGLNSPQSEVLREIILAGGAGTFTLRRDDAGRLRGFPFFFRGMSLQAEFEYGRSDDIKSIGVFVSGEEPWLFEFPEGFLPCGGSAVSSPIKASRGGVVFQVFFFESAGFLSETWYDGEGNFLAYYKAEISRTPSSWRIRSLEKRGPGGVSIEDRFFDSEGNITELSSPEGSFTALYRLKRPLYWEQTNRAAADTVADALPDAAEQTAGAAISFILQWDERGFLTLMKYARANEGNIAECRYEYEEDTRGNWIKRQALSMRADFGLLIPGAGLPWSRQITYEAVSAGGD
jgi:hypothetical protein